MLENEFEIFYTEGWRENIIVRYICVTQQKKTKIDIKFGF